MSDEIRAIAQKEFDLAIAAAMAEGARRERKFWRTAAGVLFGYFVMDIAMELLK